MKAAVAPIAFCVVGLVGSWWFFRSPPATVSRFEVKNIEWVLFVEPTRYVFISRDSDGNRRNMRVATWTVQSDCIARDVASDALPWAIVYEDESKRKNRVELHLSALPEGGRNIFSVPACKRHERN